MGAWGYKPFDNDAALDFLAGIADGIAAKALRTKDPQELIAGVEAISRLGVVIDSKTAKKLARRLGSVLADKKWMAGWRDGGRAYRKVIGNLISEVKGMGL
jgi:hypothetical protein